VPLSGSYMLKLDLENKRFEIVRKQPMKEAGIRERYDFQEWIWNSTNQFNQEIDERVSSFSAKKSSHRRKCAIALTYLGSTTAILSLSS
jgi:hypothetical protein